MSQPIVIRRLLVLLVGMAAGAPLGAQQVSTASDAEIVGPGIFFVVDSANQLRRFELSAPGVAVSTMVLSTANGSALADAIVGIDFRPATGQLYGVGASSRLYVIDPLNARALPAGPVFTPLLMGSTFGFDFDPRTDRGRVVSDAEQNLRLDPSTGTVLATDSPIHPAGSLTGIAYSNNTAGVATSTLFGIDTFADTLVIQSPENGGLLTPVGSLGVDTSSAVGLDWVQGTLYALLTIGGMPALYTISTSTGAASLIGPVSLGGQTARGLAVATGPTTLVGLTTSQHLVQFSSSAPGLLTSNVPVSGLQPGEALLGIDFRPATGALYGLGDGSRLYVLDPVSGAATVVGSAFTPALSGTAFGFDFNPQSDRIRVVSDNGQNLRLNPSTAAIFVDAALNPAGTAVAAAQTNNAAGAISTTLYDLDAASDLLLIQSPPNNGVLNAVGPLGLDFDERAGFDVSCAGVPLASLTTPGASSSGLFRLDLATGSATAVGTIGGGTALVDLSAHLLTELVYVLVNNAGTQQLYTFNAAVPGIALDLVGISGLQAGETLLGIDVRPADRRLYGVGSTSRLYRIDPLTGAATAVGGPFSPLLTGTSFGVDFNPVADRLRIVSDAEQNLRVNPDNGAIAGIDSALNPAGNVVAAGYTNNVVGTTTTTLYDIDSASNQLEIQDPPNSGTLVPVGSLGIDIGPAAGFDIAPDTGHALLAGYVGAAASPTLHRLDLATGTATLIGNLAVTGTLIDLTAQAIVPSRLFRDAFETGDRARWSQATP